MNSFVHFINDDHQFSEKKNNDEEKNCHNWSPKWNIIITMTNTIMMMMMITDQCYVSNHREREIEFKFK